MNKQAAKSSCFFTYESLIWEAHLTYIRQAAHSEQFVRFIVLFLLCCGEATVKKDSKFIQYPALLPVQRSAADTPLELSVRLPGMETF